MFKWRKEPPSDSPLRERVEKALVQAQAYARSHGGKIELVDVRENEVILKLKGTCSFCPLSKITLQKGVVEVLQELVPEITKVTTR